MKLETQNSEVMILGQNQTPEPEEIKQNPKKRKRSSSKLRYRSQLDHDAEGYETSDESGIS